MANGADHIAAGALTGLVMACYGKSKGENVNPLLAIGTSTVFSKLPDWIEPPSINSAPDWLAHLLERRTL